MNRTMNLFHNHHQIRSSLSHLTVPSRELVISNCYGVTSLLAELLFGFKRIAKARLPNKKLNFLALNEGEFLIERVLFSSLDNERSKGVPSAGLPEQSKTDATIIGADLPNFALITDE